MVVRHVPVKAPLSLPQVARLLAVKDNDFPLFVRLGVRQVSLGAHTPFPPNGAHWAAMVFHTDASDPDGCPTGDVWAELTGEMRKMKATEKRKSMMQFIDADRLYVATGVTLHKGIVTITTERA